jgi:hypothetical protein
MQYLLTSQCACFLSSYYKANKKETLQCKFRMVPEMLGGHAVA